MLCFELSTISYRVRRQAGGLTGRSSDPQIADPARFFPLHHHNSQDPLLQSHYTRSTAPPGLALHTSPHPCLRVAKPSPDSQLLGQDTCRAHQTRTDTPKPHKTPCHEDERQNVAHATRCSPGPQLQNRSILKGDVKRGIDHAGFPGRLVVKLRRILSPQADSSSTCKTFSALTALPRLLCSPDPGSWLCSKLYSDMLGLCGDNCGERPAPADRGELGALSLLAVPRGDLGEAPSTPNAGKLRWSVISSGERSGGSFGLEGFCSSTPSSTKISGTPNCGTPAIRADLFSSMCCLNRRDQYLSKLAICRQHE